jgi:hypothetical protein
MFVPVISSRKYEEQKHELSSYFVIMCVQQICHIYINNICFLKHCYMFRSFYIILRESLILYPKVTKP